MFRVIRSTVQGLDIDQDQAEAFEQAIDTALNAGGAVRETYGLDDIGQKEYHIALLPYTDPDGEHRWAVLNSGPAEVDWQDTCDLAEAVAAYEDEVRDTTAGAMPEYDDEGDELPLWNVSDVKGIAARDEQDGDDHSNTARLTDAEWAHAEFTSAEDEYHKAAQRRQVAFARVIDGWGRGGQAVLARRVGLKEPTVKALADRGREILLGVREDA